MFFYLSLLAWNSESWLPLRRARDSFFKRLKQSDVRDVVETVDWTPDLAVSALRYAQSYRELIDDLVSHRADVSELREALSIDSLLIRNASSGGQEEEAI